MISMLCNLMLGLTFASAAPVKIGLILDKGGKDDHSFNAAAFAGATQAQKEQKFEFQYLEAPDDHSFEALLRNMVSKDFGLIISVGFSQAEAVRKVAAKFPNKKFAIVDGKVELPNVKSLMFEEHQGSFLVGALAAMYSKSPSIGFIGGMDIPLIRRFEMAYKAGVEYIKPSAKIVSQYIGVSGDAWNNPTKAKEIALSQYSSGVNVIFAVAGASNMGIFDAAQAKKEKAIGVDSNQNGIKPGTILTSMLKRVDVAVHETCTEFVKGNFKNGVFRFGLKEKGVDYALDEHNKALITESQKSRLEEIRKKIISGEINVPDYYLIKK